MNANTVRLTRAGPDGLSGTGDDIAITPTGITLTAPNQVTVDLGGVKLPDDIYTVTLDGTHASLVFNGSQRITIPDQAYYQIQDVTLEAWIRYDDSSHPAQIIFRGDDRASYDPYTLTLMTGGILQLQIGTQDGSSYAAFSSGPLPAGEWIHTAGSFNSSTNTLSLYVNGHLVGTGQSSGIPVQQLTGPNPGLGIGSLQSSTGNGFTGAIRDARIWSVVRTQSDILATMKQPLSGIEPGLVANWPLNEGSGQVVRDITSHANSGTIGADATPGGDDPAWVNSWITDVNGNVLDGDFPGTSGGFPSGNGSPGGEFASTFTLATPKLTVTGINPAPGSLLSAPPLNILGTFSKNIDPATVNAATVTLTGAGPDGIFGTTDDVSITPASISLVGTNQVSMDLTGAVFADGFYQVRIASGNANGLVGCWALDDGSGSSASDSSGNGNNGIVSNGAIWTKNGKTGGALQFDGVGGQVTVPSTTSLEPASAITVCTWANISSTSGAYADLLRKAAPFNNGWNLRWNDGSGVAAWHVDTPTFAYYVPDTQQNSAYLNGWHHFAGTLDASGNAKLYVDGLLHNSVKGSPTTMVKTDDLYFMFVNYPQQRAIPGRLDDVRIYNRALSEPEVQNLAGLLPRIADQSGNALDGEYPGLTGGFPSGNDITGGDFASTFQIETPPVAQSGSLTTNEDTPASSTLSATQTDGHPLVYRIVANGTKGTATIVNSTTGAFTYLPNLNAEGADTFTFVAFDGYFDSNLATFTVTILQTAPVITSAASTIGTVSGDLTYAIAATHNPVSFGATGLPLGLNLDPATGFITGAPKTAGTFNISLSATNLGGIGTLPFVLVVSKGLPIVTWSNPADITHPTALDSAQLNASASVPGTFTYSPGSGTVLSAGAGQSLELQFTPADSADYVPVNATVKINVARGTPSITWLTPADIDNLTPLSNSQLNATANVPGSFSYLPGNGTLLNAGAGQSLGLQFVPADSANYVSSNATVKINVAKAIPSITWPTPADIEYLTPLSSSQLNASANVPGSFSYNFTNGTVLNAGSHVISGLFTPSDTNYSAAAASVTLNVNKAIPIVTWLPPAKILAGTPLSAVQLNATANVPGTFTYSPLLGTVLPVGAMQVLYVQFAPADIANFNTPPMKTTSLTVDPLPAIMSGGVDGSGHFVAGQAVQFSIASQPGAVLWTWDFGDGTTAITNSAEVAHVFSPAGNYTVTVIASNGAGASASQSQTITVAASSVNGPQGELDSDGDGFSDALETALASNPLDAHSTPMDVLTSSTPKKMTVTRLTTALDFKHERRDSIVLVGTLELQPGFTPAGIELGVDVAGVAVGFTLSGNGTARTENGRFILQKLLNSNVTSRARFTFTSAKGSFAKLLGAPMGTQASVTTTPKSIHVTLLLDNNIYGADVPQSYIVKGNIRTSK